MPGVAFMVMRGGLVVCSKASARVDRSGGRIIVLFVSSGCLKVYEYLVGECELWLGWNAGWAWLYAERPVRKWMGAGGG